MVNELGNAHSIMTITFSKNEIEKTEKLEIICEF